MAGERQRVDKWLFFSRAVKSRTLGQKLVQLGRVRINGERAELSSEMIKLGDTLTLTMDRRILVWRVVGLGERRGAPAEAQMLYEDLSPKPGTDPAPPDDIEPLRVAKRAPG